MNLDYLQEIAVDLLVDLIATPSISGEEDKTAGLIFNHLKFNGVDQVNSFNNNIWAVNKYFDSSKPSILLNSHHDTVKPNKGYTRDPFSADIEGDILYGLGSNDAGASVVSLLSTFLNFYEKKDLKYNIIIAITAEEENSGSKGISSLLDKLPEFEFAIVGEPTEMHLAIAEKGLMVIEGYVHGKAGHAARNEGDNAIYKALKDIEWFKNYKFDRISESLGEVKMNLTQIEAGSQHNVVPALCKYVVDVRSTDAYTNEEILKIINENTLADINPRSVRFNPSFISMEHPIVKAGIKLGRKTYGSPTMSDQALIKQSSLKLGPGDSARSHTADEFVKISEIKQGVDLYIKILNQVLY